MQGPLNETNKGFLDLSAREAWVIAPLLVLIVALGVYPKPLIDAINPAVQATLCHNDAHRPCRRPTSSSSASSPVSTRFNHCDPNCAIHGRGMSK